MQKKNIDFVQNFVLSGLLFLAFLAMCSGFVACNQTVGGGGTRNSVSNFNF